MASTRMHVFAALACASALLGVATGHAQTELDAIAAHQKAHQDAKNGNPHSHNGIEADENYIENPHEWWHLIDVPELDFNPDQVVCAGKYCDEVKLTQLRCLNAGGDNEWVIKWDCATDEHMPDGFTLDNVEVKCQGYRMDDDPYVYRDTCKGHYYLKHNQRDEL
eukprot:GFYU01002448.1.p2 GENE.GFYU01002448.1~~GFYU01002448.1.p2  ORF type:complete len:165 (-),score=59.10 GFYU01002448.1:239-733(-)